MPKVPPKIHPSPEVPRFLRKEPSPPSPYPASSLLRYCSTSVPYCIQFPVQNQVRYGCLHRNVRSKVFLPPSRLRNSDISYNHPLAACKATDSRQLFISMAMVMGPTPPGTGVMALHIGSTLSKSTSPHNLFSALR